MKHIIIDGKVWDWKTIRQMRRDQINENRRKRQLTLFELRTDSRPQSQKTASGRYVAPLLFKE